MATMNISLPEPMREFVEQEVAEGGYATTSEYFRQLVRERQKQKAQEKLEGLLLEGLNSPAGEMTAQDWAEIRQEVRDRIAARKQNGSGT
jgi:antitoxin ParD1/3/4